MILLSAINLLINNYNNGNNDIGEISFNNNYILYKNPINICNTNNNKKEKIESGEKNKQNNFTLKDLSLSTPLKVNEFTSPNFKINETNRMFIKTEKNLNESNNILEKSAFNRQILNDMPFPYSNIKAHLYFTSSIKKPIKIISDESANNPNINMNNNNNIQNEPNLFINNNNNYTNNGNSNAKNYFQNMENLTPNKLINYSENNGSNTLFKFNNIVYSSSKKPEGFKSSAINMNNPYQVFSPSKNLTPFKISTANLDKMFFSSLNSKN